MPLQVFTDACLNRFSGPVSIIADPVSGLGGNLSVAGSATVVGSLLASGGLNVSGTLTGVAMTAVSGLAVSNGLVVSGGATLNGGQALNGGFAVSGGATIDSLANLIGQLTATSAQAIASGSAISVSKLITRISVNDTAAATSCTMPASATQGQVAILLNESSLAVSMAASGTSHVMNGAACIVPTYGQKTLVWNGTLWVG
jgi:hypothetical protein